MGYVTSNVFEAPEALRAATASTALAVPRFSSAGLDSYLGANGVDYFAGCQSVEDVKTRHRELARKNHPDAGGSQAVMAEINRQRAIRDAFYTGAQKAAETSRRAAEPETRVTYTQEPEAAQRAQEAATGPQTETFSETMRTQTGGQNTTAQQSGAVSQKSAKIVEHLRNNAQMLMQMEPVATVTGSELPKQGRATDRALAFLQSIGNKVTRSGFGEVLFSRKKLKNSLVGHGVGTAKLETIAAVPAVVQNGTIIDHIQNYEGRGYDTYLIGAPVNYKGQSVLVGVVVAKDNQTGRYYVHEVVDSNGNILMSEKEPEVNADNSPQRDEVVIPPTLDSTKTGFGAVDDTIPQQETAVNSGLEGLRLPTVEGTQPPARQDAGGGMELPRLLLPTVEGIGTQQTTGAAPQNMLQLGAAVDVGPEGLSLPTLDEGRLQPNPIFDEWPEGFAEAIRQQLIDGMLEDISRPGTNPGISPTGLSLPTPDEVRPQPNPIFDDWPEGFAEAIRQQLMGGIPENVSQPETAVNTGLERVNPSDFENGLLKMFKSMGEYMRKDGFFDLESAKKDYNISLKTVPKKNKMFLEQSSDAVEYIRRRLVTVPFSYDPKHDVIYYDPDHPEFMDQDFRVVITHELSHRIGDMLAHSTKNAEFSRAIAEAARVLDSDVKKFVQYSFDADEDGFISDIFSAICNGKEKFFANHPPDYWAKPGNKEKEIFANLFSLEAFNDAQKWAFLEENFPDLIRTYLNFEYLL